MLVELGPVTATDVLAWTRFARRLVSELRTNPDDLEGVLSSEMLDDWSRLFDEWATLAAESDSFRWSRTLDTEVAEFLLHGFVSCYRSPGLATHITDDEWAVHRPFTVHVISAFVDGLEVEGRSYAHYVEEIRGSFGDTLD